MITTLTKQSLTYAFSYVNGEMAMTDAERVKRFLDLTSDFSVRRAGAFIGVKGATIHEWRKGTTPEKLRDDNRIAIDNFIEMGGPDALDDPAARDRMVDLLVAERLERMAAELRAEAAAKAPPPHEVTTQVKRAASAVKSAQKRKGQKREDRKAE